MTLDFHASTSTTDQKECKESRGGRKERKRERERSKHSRKRTLDLMKLECYMVVTFPTCVLPALRVLSKAESSLWLHLP